MRFATLISWFFTASLGAFMLRTWLARDGLRRERAKVGGLPPPFIFGHATAAIVGLLTWVAFVASGVRAFAWAAVCLLTVAVSLGLCTVTLWTPYPARRPGERRSFSIWDIRPDPPDPPDLPDLLDPPGDAPSAAGRPAMSRDAPAQATGKGDGDAHPGYEVTDEMISRFLADPTPHASPIRLNPAVIIPVIHGFAALITYLLAMMSAIS